MEYKIIENINSLINYEKTLTAAFNCGGFPNLLFDLKNNSFKKLFFLENKIIEIEIKKRKKDLYIITDEIINKTNLKYLKEEISRILQLKNNLQEFYKEVKKKDIKLIEEFEGLVIFQDDNLLEATIKAIIGQQISMKAANILIQRFMDLFYNKYNALYVIPNGITLEKRINEKINELTFLTKRKNEYLINLVQWWNSNEEKSYKNMMKIKGIGPWSASYGMIYGASATTHILESDLGLHRCCEIFYNFEHRSISTKNVLQNLNKYKYQTYYMFYLWEYGFKYGVWGKK